MAFTFSQELGVYVSFLFAGDAALLLFITTCAEKKIASP